MKPSTVKHLLDYRYEDAWSDWRWQMRSRIETATELLESSPSLRDRIPSERISEWIEREFRFGVTPYYLSLADFQDPLCPILRQILPDEAEISDSLFENPDPLAEESHMPLPGMTHRYPDRVLWYLTHNCAVYCRFCLRKRKVGRAESAAASTSWEDGFRYIESNRSIKEVILSGGDPLSLSDDKIELILSRLRTIKHLYSIRIHTRMPVTLPMRFTDELCAILKDNYPITLVAHFNHAKEITPEAAAAVRNLRMNGVLVLNQSVLLSGVNDSEDAMEELLLSLLRAGIKPYYLHQCDEVHGVSHFRVPIARGLEIMRNLQGKNPGIAFPKYMLDLPGGGGKIPLENVYEQPSATLNRAANPEMRKRIFKNWAGEEFEISP